MPTLPVKFITTANTMPQVVERVQDILGVNFVGDGVNITVTANSNTKTVLITGSGGGSANFALFANYAFYAGNATFAYTANVALTANYALTANFALFANYAFYANVANSAVFANTAANATYALTANNALFLDGEPGSYYLNVSNFTGGTISPLLLPIANTTVNGIVDIIAQSFAGVKTFTANTELNGYANVGLTLQVAGLTTLIGNTSLTDTLTVTGNTTLNANIALNANVAVVAGSFLSLGMSPAANAVVSVNGQYFSALVTDGNSGSSFTLNWALGNEHELTLNNNVTLATANAVDGGRYCVIINSGAGAFTVSWPGNWLWPGGTAPTQTVTASKRDLYTAMYLATPNVYIGSYNQNY